jgi:Ca2+-binding RTX toxin-like protein
VRSQGGDFLTTIDFSGVALAEDTLTGGAANPGIGLWVNPGGVLRFNPVDVDGWKTQNRERAGEFALYDEYNPLRAIRVTSVDGWSGPLTWVASGTYNPAAGYDFLLNFDPTEGVLRPGYVLQTNGNKSINVPAVRDDGNDAIFGGTGNDWLVGGSGKDTAYGGWGNDLLNADDDHRTNFGG